MTAKEGFIPYQAQSLNPEDTKRASSGFYQLMDKRRSLRNFSNQPVAREVIENLILTASSAPSGAHKQPWTFCAVSAPEIKKQIRAAAEAEEYENYHGRMSDEWLKDLEKFNTNWKKEFLEIAPYLIVVFKKTYDVNEGDRSKNYYVNESVGLACGFLLTAIHNAGLVALTHTPSPLGFLHKILKRPENEKPFLLIPVGYPADDALVPILHRRELDEVAAFYE